MEYNITMKYIEEQRAEARLPVEHNVLLMFKRSTEFDMVHETISTGRVIDRSPHGLCLFTPRFVKVHDLLNVSFNPAEDSEVYFDVRWVYQVEDGYMFGCRLVFNN